MKDAVAVIDIGMTNKKIALYDRDLRHLASRRRVFDPLMVEGLAAHDLTAMEDWFLETLRELSLSFAIGSIAVSAHGATVVCLDAAGNPAAPCIYYTHEPGPEFHARFYAAAGAPDELQAVTGTPNFSALINPAKGLFFLRERFPEAYAKTKLVLPYPQYWGMRLTGLAGVEGTYIGSHSYLWDWRTEKYSQLLDTLGLCGKLPEPLRQSWSALGRIKPSIAARTGLGESTLVTMGIHDSNASLLPYLVSKRDEDFVLNSTGSWCVIMHPQPDYGFAPDELGKVVFFNRSAYNKPVKTAIFTGGLEYEAWSRLVAAAMTKVENEKPRPAEPDQESYRRVIAERNFFILPELIPGSGQFPGSAARVVDREGVHAFADLAQGQDARIFAKDEAGAMAALNLSLAIQTLVALERAGLRRGAALYIEGGFRDNADYNGLLAAALPGNPVYLTDMTEATSLGAAMTALAALENVAPDALADRLRIKLSPLKPMTGLEGFGGYMEKWLALASET